MTRTAVKARSAEGATEAKVGATGAKAGATKGRAGAARGGARPVVLEGGAAAAQAGAVEAGRVPAHGTVVEIALDRLKRSPRNVRRTPHSGAHIEALAGSIAAKGMLQKPVVEPERDEAGAFTGSWLVTIGEGRRLAQVMRAGRGEIGADELVSCVVDLANDPEEISLDENVTREDLHPADQFEAFLDQSQRLGRSAEEIAARFGVSPAAVRRRLRLARVSPALMAAYREGQIDLDALMAFAVSEDHARQEQVLASLPPYRVDPSYIRRLMTETKAPAHDRRAAFVGAEAYEAAGGTILRDLFTEDRGGWFEDVPLLDRLALERLAGEAEALRAAEGWKWAEAHVDYPHHLGLARVYPAKVERTEAEQARMAALSEEYDGLLVKWDHLDEVPPDVAARLEEIDAELQAFGDGYAYRPEDVARCGLIVVLDYEGGLRIERGFLRPEDTALEAGDEDGGADDAEDRDDAADDGRDPGDGPAGGADEEPEDAGAPLSAALVAELSAYRTAGLRDALSENPDAALRVTVHALALAVFCPGAPLTCADLRLTHTWLGNPAPGIGEAPAMRRIETRREAWTRDLPQDPKALWDHVVGLDHDSLMALLAHCVAHGVNAVHSWERRPGAWGHADALAAHLRLDMTTTWAATAERYFARVTKARIASAVREAVSDEAAAKIADLKKPQMAEAAEALVAGTGWLPELLRTPGASIVGSDQEGQPCDAANAAKQGGPELAPEVVLAAE
jgi:ParB family chromosome partitioning protein